MFSEQDGPSSVAGRSARYNPSRDDPWQFDEYILKWLIGEFGRPIELALDQLRSRQYQFSTMQDLHDDAVDVELFYRQAIPAAGLALRTGHDVAEIARFLCLFGTCQTLILNNIDRHLDLSSSYTIRDPSRLLSDSRAVTCYAVASLYTGMIEGLHDLPASRALGAMARVSLGIIQSMNDNWMTRFAREDLELPDLLMHKYQDGVRTRHLGSGFYSSSILALYAFMGKELPIGFPAILLSMRRLRQRVDELADLYEDVMTGLLTYPVAVGLSFETHRKQLTGSIGAAWERALNIVRNTGRDAGETNALILNDATLQACGRELVDILEESGAMRVCYEEASDLWETTSAAVVACSDSAVPHVLLPVIDAKRAFLERLSRNSWLDAPPPYSLPDLVSRLDRQPD